MSTLELDHDPAANKVELTGEHLIVDLAGPKHKEENRRTPIVYAADKGHRAIVDKLKPLSTPSACRQAELTLKAALQGPVSDEVTLYLKAARRGSFKLVRDYLDAGGDVDAIDQGGKTALFEAAWCGAREVVDLLVSRGADIHHQDAYGNYPADYAILGEKYAVFIHLVDQMDKKRRKKHQKDIPFYCLVARRQQELASILSNNPDADPRVLKFHESAKSGNANEVEAYLGTGGSVDAIDNEGVTAAHHAAVGGHVDILRTLIARGANVNQIASRGSCPLIAAANAGEGDAYDLLFPLTDPALQHMAEKTKKYMKGRCRWKQGGRIQLG